MDLFTLDGRENNPGLLAVIRKSKAVQDERFKLINPLNDKVQSLKEQAYQELFGKNLNTLGLFFKAIRGYDFPEGGFKRLNSTPL